MYTKIEIFEAGCEKCGHVWIPKNQEQLPAMCPSCKSKTWNGENNGITDISGNNHHPAARNRKFEPKIASSEPLKAENPPKEPVLTMYSEERTVYDPVTGENVTYREHIKSRNRIIIKRETAY
jgi:hypothetical protein